MRVFKRLIWVGRAQKAAILVGGAWGLRQLRPELTIFTGRGTLILVDTVPRWGPARRQKDCSGRNHAPARSSSTS